jgi:hypothetical protein
MQVVSNPRWLWANLDAAPANVEFKFRDAEGNVKA